MAAERTLLAWLRTGLALMGFGFVVAKFGIFLRELAASRGLLPSPSPSVVTSQWLGTTLVLLGVLVNVIAALQHARFIERYNSGETPRAHPASMGVVLSVGLALLGVGVAVYLLRLQ
ncbi:YidH family protein [Polyangium spumosum]|nr:DUF202 domain-containing protein [Polyangium spumosum]